MKKNILIIASSIVLALFASCTQGVSKTDENENNDKQEETKEPERSMVEANDPSNGECIFEASVDEESEGFKVNKTITDDGYQLTSIDHETYAMTDFYQLTSPNGNIRLVASGCSEACAITGYTIDYAKDGKVSTVNFVGALDDDEYRKLNNTAGGAEIIKNWLFQSSQSDPVERFAILRDESGEVTQVGKVEVPLGYQAKYYLGEWGPFWYHDLDGGVLGFFVLLESKETDGSYVNYLYCDNKLIAELAYWQGKFIKARTYNRWGVMVRQYSDRDMNVQDQAFSDYGVSPKWYVGE